MKHLVIVTRDFPPFVGRGAVLRCLKFAKYLPDFNVRVTVLCEKKDTEEDATLLKELSEHVQIIPIENPSPRNIKNKRKKKFRTRKTLKNLMLLLFARIHDLFFQMRKNRLFPDEWIYLAKAMQRYIDHHDLKADAFLLSGPPFSMMTINTRTIPFFLDYRDAWSLNPLFEFRNVRKQRRCEYHWLEKAQSAFFVTTPLIEDYKLTFPIFGKKYLCLTNGFDEENISNLEYIKEENRKKLRFIYSGSIGSSGRYAKYLLEAFKAYFIENPNAKKIIEIHFVGGFAENKDTWENYFKSAIFFHGSINHQDNINLINNCDITLFISSYTQGGRGLAPGKIYEYLALKKPTLAMANDCFGTDLLKESGLLYYSEENDIEACKIQIRNIVEDWKSDSLKTMSESFDLNRFSRKRLSKRLAKEIFNV